MDSKQFVCIVCPNSCRLTVENNDGEFTVSGHECKRGIDHGIKEYSCPERMLTTTVAVTGGILPRIPVISTDELPKSKLSECLEALYSIKLTVPLSCGDVVYKNICDTGVDIITSRSMKGNGIKNGK